MSNSSDFSPELQKLCERAAQEQNPEALRELTEQINLLLNERLADRKVGSSRGNKSAA
jgi:hypothetical protein